MLIRFLQIFIMSFFSTNCHFVVGLSARSYKDRSCSSRRTMMYCELLGGMRMSNHCDVTFTEWGLPLPLILFIIAFDECTGWLSFDWCISLICMGDLIGYLIGVTMFVKQHIHYRVRLYLASSFVLRTKFFVVALSESELACPNFSLIHASWKFIY